MWPRGLRSCGGGTRKDTAHHQLQMQQKPCKIKITFIGRGRKPPEQLVRIGPDRGGKPAMQRFHGLPTDRPTAKIRHIQFLNKSRELISQGTNAVLIMKKWANRPANRPDRLPCSTLGKYESTAGTGPVRTRLGKASRYQSSLRPPASDRDSVPVDWRSRTRLDSPSLLGRGNPTKTK